MSKREKLIQEIIKTKKDIKKLEKVLNKTPKNREKITVKELLDSLVSKKIIRDLS